MFSPRRLLALAATAIAFVSAQTRYFDSETGITFSESTVALSLTQTMRVRIALPDTAQSFQPYDVVIQVVAPNVGWIGFGWGAGMLRNPLTIFWAYQNQVVLSSRYATGRAAAPPPYAGATLELFTAGTRVTSSTIQFTALCRGCTSYVDGNGATRYVGPSGSSNRIAWAARFSPVNSASNTSSFLIHDVHNIWQHDFAMGKNPNWNDLLIRNLGHA